MSIIEAKGLARTFKSRKRTVEAVRGVDLTVAEGEIVGFLGPNGAGKTTTLRMLTTLLGRPRARATVAGADLLRDPVGVRGGSATCRRRSAQTMGGTDPTLPGRARNCSTRRRSTASARRRRVRRAELLTEPARPQRPGPAAGEDAVRRPAAAA